MCKEIFETLKSISCNEKNVADVCAAALKDYQYSYGSSKIIIYKDDFVFKKIYGKVLKDEYEIYKRALNAGVAEFFVASWGKKDSIYIQQKIEISLNEYAHDLKEKIPYGSYREAYRILGLQEMLYRSDCVVLYYLFQEHSLAEILKLQEFIVENNLTDLNFYNAGFLDGHIVFFDYSGMDMELME